MEEIREYHDKKSESYDSVFDALYFKVYDAITWRYIEPYVPTKPNAVVLDAGSGTVRWAIRMAEKGCKVVLMDSSQEMLNAATKKVQAKVFQHRIVLEQGDVVDTGYEDESFDMVLCENALSLFKEPDVVLFELRRVLKKNLALVASAKNRYVQALSFLAGKPRVDNVERAFKVLVNKEHECMTKEGEVKIYMWTPQEFKEIIERNGFRVEKMVGKVATMPLRVRQEFFMVTNHPTEIFNQLLQFELELCKKPDALALAGYLQAIAFKI